MVMQCGQFILMKLVKIIPNWLYFAGLFYHFFLLLSWTAFRQISTIYYSYYCLLITVFLNFLCLSDSTQVCVVYRCSNLHALYDCCLLSISPWDQWVRMTSWCDRSSTFQCKEWWKWDSIYRHHGCQNQFGYGYGYDFRLIIDGIVQLIM